ncbi:MAG: YraN family protein [Firmicutes bacterium]|nr:YraN family protein [Bacillota bacterium]
MENKNIVLGMIGEERAADYLDNIGYKIIKRNYRCRYGEIDIIAMKQEVLCFIEVKTRASVRYGAPCEAVDERKKQHIIRCAYDYMDKFGGVYNDIRLEIIELLYSEGRFYIRHIKEC